MVKREAPEDGAELALLGGNMFAEMTSIQELMWNPTPQWTHGGDLHEAVGVRWILRTRPARATRKTRRDFEQCLASAERSTEIVRAVPLATQAIAADPDDSRGWRLRSDLRRRAGDLWGAAWDAAVAVHRRP